MPVLSFARSFRRDPFWRRFDSLFGTNRPFYVRGELIHDGAVYTYLYSVYWQSGGSRVVPILDLCFQLPCAGRAEGDGMVINKSDFLQN